MGDKFLGGVAVMGPTWLSAMIGGLAVRAKTGSAGYLHTADVGLAWLGCQSIKHREC